MNNTEKHIIELKPCCLECYEFDPDVDRLIFFADGLGAETIGCKHMKVCESYHHDNRPQISEIVTDYISHGDPSLE